MNHQYSASCDTPGNGSGENNRMRPEDGPGGSEKDAFGLVIKAIEAGIEDGSIKQDADPLVSALLAWAELNGVIWLLRSRERIIAERWSIGGEDIVDTFFENTRKSLRA